MICVGRDSVMLGGLRTLSTRHDRYSGSTDDRFQAISKSARLVVVFSALAVLSGALASCGGGQTESKPDSISVVDPEPTPTLAPPIAPSLPDNSEPESEDSDSPVKPDDPEKSANSTPDPDNSDKGSIPSPTPDPSSTPVPKPSQTPAPTPTPTSTPKATSSPEPDPPLFTNYDIELSEGDFWRFRWEWTDRSCSQGSGCSNTDDTGVYQVTLGKPTHVNGVTMFEVASIGDSDYIDGQNTHSFTPEWKYIGVDGHRIVVTNSVSGASTPVTLFDAQVGVWAGSSFFSGRFSDDLLIQANPGQLSSGHLFTDWDGVEPGPWHFVRSADSGGECSLFDGRILCPTEEKFDFTQNEYYRPGIGPFGYQYTFSASFSGGGFSSNFASEERVALIASSFQGDEAGDFGKPTPVPPTPTPEPTPAPIVLGDPIYGPIDGDLELSLIANQVPEFAAGLNIDAGVADVVFINPNVSGKWSHGITFRQSGEETFHAVFINSDGEWGHFARGGSLSSQITIALGEFDFETSVGGQNRLTVWFGIVAGANAGIIQINGQDVAILDLSYAGASSPGDVKVISGFFPSDDFNGESTRFTGFTVYEKP